MDIRSVGSERLRRTGLMSNLPGGPVDIVRHHLAMQSQDFMPAKWALAQRVQGAYSASIERLVSKGSILRTHVMRPTWHFVARQDLRWLMELTGPKVLRGSGARQRELGLDAATNTKGEKVIVRGLEDGGHLTRKEIGTLLARAGLDPDGQRLPYFIMHCELLSIVCSGEVRGKDQTYALFDERVPTGRAFDRDKAIVELVRRYLSSHGPATLKDMSWWSGLNMTELRTGLEANGATSQKVGGSELWSLDSAPRKSGGKRAHLLQAYDEFVVGYTESRYLGDPRASDLKHAFKVGRLPTGTVLLDDRIVGHWRRAVKGDVVEVEVVLYRRLRGSDSDALEAAAREFGAFMKKEPRLSTRLL